MSLFSYFPTLPQRQRVSTIVTFYRIFPYADHPHIDVSIYQLQQQGLLFRLNQLRAYASSVILDAHVHLCNWVISLMCAFLPRWPNVRKFSFLCCPHQCSILRLPAIAPTSHFPNFPHSLPCPVRPLMNIQPRWNIGFSTTFSKAHCTRKL